MQDMSKHLTSVSFHSTKGSLIHVQAELHHDIDYSCFDSSENMYEKNKNIKDNKNKKRGIIEGLSNVNLQGKGIKNKLPEEKNLSTSSTDFESDEYEDDFEEDDEDEEQQKKKQENKKKENLSQAFDDNDDVEMGRMPDNMQVESEESDRDDPALDITSKQNQEDTDGITTSGKQAPQAPEEHLKFPKCSTSKQKVELRSYDASKNKSVSKIYSERTDSKKENGKGKKASVVRFNHISTKKSSENIRKSPKVKKQNPKELMNCIAYNETKNDDESKSTSPSPDFLSVSTDTTSEITDVTTRPSSSGCSSLARNDSVEHTEVQEEDKIAEGNRSKPPMKFPSQTIISLERQKRPSMTSSMTSLDSRNGTMDGRNSSKRRNMSFSNNQLWHIERENSILLRKLEELRRPSQKSLTRAQSVVYPRLSSSAINRRKQQQKINHDNLILLRKIDEAKPTLPTRTSMKT